MKRQADRAKAKASAARRRAGNRDGFTLIELLVVIANGGRDELYLDGHAGWVRKAISNQ
jgi:hypothetical protein